MSMDQFFLQKTLTDWLLRRTGSSAVRRVAELPVAIASTVGLIRTENQDRVVVVRHYDAEGDFFVLALVCDGMGGMADGAVCASTAVASFTASILATNAGLGWEERLIDAAKTANKCVYERYQGEGGATLSAVLFDGSAQAYWVNVGDSRIYRFAYGHLDQITVDDTLAGQLSRDLYEGRTELLQYIGTHTVEPHSGVIPITMDQPTVLLSSDGVHYLPPNITQEILAHAPEPALAARRLIDLATWCGGADNASAALIDAPSIHRVLLPNTGPNVVDVWDPFGEIRLVFSLGADPIESTSDRRQSTNQSADRVEPRKVTTRSKRITRRKPRPEADSEKESADEPPQLLMNFRKKEDLDDR